MMHLDGATHHLPWLPTWRGLPLFEIVRQAGGTTDSRVQVLSLESEGYNHSLVEGPQLAAALLATHVNRERLDVDHGC